MKILLVDDETSVTEALDRLLCQIGDPSWDIVTAGSGPEALERLEEQRFHVLVADLQMPKMSGDELLATVGQRWPETVRIVLSGQATEVAAARAARHAHQFLAKPCTHQMLVAALERSERFARVIRDPLLRSALGGTTALPPAPATYARLTALLASPDSCAADVANVIRADPALSAKVLQLVNSAFFAAATRITDVGRAATRLGMRTIQTVVLSAEVHRMAAERGVGADLWREGERVADLVAEIGAGRRWFPDAWTAALLSPVGLLALVSTRPELVKALVTRPSDPEADRELLGVNRYYLSWALLSVWGLPDAVVEPLRCVEQPIEAPERDRLVACALNVALARATGRPADPSSEHRLRAA